jgi:hypothetical protein
MDATPTSELESKVRILPASAGRWLLPCLRPFDDEAHRPRGALLRISLYSAGVFDDRLLPGATVRRIPVWRQLELRLDTAQICRRLVVSAIL